jgi:hypothetical protein
MRFYAHRIVINSHFSANIQVPSWGVKKEISRLFVARLLVVSHRLASKIKESRSEVPAIRPGEK